MQKAVICGALIVLATSGANAASPCDDFNLLRFNPSRLEECIKHLKFMTDVQINTLEAENRGLQAQICILAFELREVRPSAFDAIKDSCVPDKPKRK